VNTETLSSLDYLTFNTRSNRVAVISSIITKTFLTLCNTGTVMFQPGSVKTLVIYIYIVHMCSCQLFIYSLSLFVIYLFVLVYSLFIIHLFCSLFDHLFRLLFVFISHQFFALFLFKRKRTILILNLCSGILIPFK
jgi:hypothetical protein